MPSRNRVWKLVGLAGAVGVVATGALVARNERERRAYSPDEVRDRLRARLVDVDVDVDAQTTPRRTPTAGTSD